jgi:DNA-directed RNA polymerase specialized sigma24 family protein
LDRLQQAAMSSSHQSKEVSIDPEPFFAAVTSHYQVTRADVLDRDTCAAQNPARCALAFMLQGVGMSVREAGGILQMSELYTHISIDVAKDNFRANTSLRATLTKLASNSAKPMMASNSTPVTPLPAPVRPDPERFLTAVCDEYGVDRNHLFSLRGNWRHDDARRLAMLLLQEHGLSSAAIAQLVQRPEAHVNSSIQTIKGRLKGDVGLRKAVENIRSKLAI